LIPKASPSSWMNVIENVNWCVTKIKFVCKKHFTPKDITKTYAEVDQFSDVKDFPKPARLRLAKGAIPKIFYFDRTDALEVNLISKTCFCCSCISI